MEQHRLRVFKNKWLWKIFRGRKNQETRENYLTRSFMRDFRLPP
jgi:hypothetical protein